MTIKFKIVCLIVKSTLIHKSLRFKFNDNYKPNKINLYFITTADVYRFLVNIFIYNSQQMFKKRNLLVKKEYVCKMDGL